MTHTQYIPEQMEFQGLGSRRVVAAANGGAIASDAGGLLLREAERRVKPIAGFAACLEDGRPPRRFGRGKDLRATHRPTRAGGE